MKKIFKEFSTLLAVSLLVILPLVANAAGGTKGGLVYECNPPGECTFDDLVAATRNVVNTLTLYAIAFSVVVIAYAGFLYMTSGGNPGKISQATGMFTKVAIGLAVVIGAWVIVNMIAKGLGVTSFSFTP
jgi:hypothetical protein